MMNELEFEIIEQQVERPDDMDIEGLSNISLEYNYKKKYDIEDLGVKTLWIVLKKSRKNF